MSGETGRGRVKSVIEPRLGITEERWVVSVLNPDESITGSKRSKRAVLVIEGLYRKAPDSLYLTPFVGVLHISTIDEAEESKELKGQTKIKKRHIVSYSESQTLAQPRGKAYHLYRHHSAHVYGDTIRIWETIKVMRKDAELCERVKRGEKDASGVPYEYPSYEQVEADHSLSEISEIGLEADCASCCIQYLKPIMPWIIRDLRENSMGNKIINGAVLTVIVIPLWSIAIGIIAMILTAALFYPAILTAFTLPATAPAFFAVTLPWIGIGFMGAVAGFLVGLLISGSLDLFSPIKYFSKSRLDLFWGLQIFGASIGPILAASFLPGLLPVFATATASTVFPWIFLSLVSWVMTLLLISFTSAIVNRIEQAKASPVPDPKPEEERPKAISLSDFLEARNDAKTQTRADTLAPQRIADSGEILPDPAVQAPPQPPPSVEEPRPNGGVSNQGVV